MLDITYTPLFLPEYQKYKGNINLMNTMVFEELYSFLYNQNAPYDGYHADGVFSPNNEYHNEYFRQYKPKAIHLFIHWEKILSPYLNDTSKRKLVQMHRDILGAQDFIDLVWVAMQLWSVVMKYLTQKKLSQ